MPTPHAKHPVISAWSAISPWGLDSTDFATGLAAGRRAHTRPEAWLGPVPYDLACLVPGFDTQHLLGKKGTRSMDRATALAVTAVGQLLKDETGERHAGVGEDTGLVLGTSTGSAQSMMDFTRDSLTGQRPYHVDPARFPNTVMNCATGQSALWHRLKGPNTTVAAGRPTGLLALQYTLRLHRAGRARTVLCGAVEEYSAARAWLDWHAREERDPTRVLGEGAAVWMLEPEETARTYGRRPLAKVAGLELAFARDEGRVRETLTTCLRRLLERTRTPAERIWAVADSTSRHPDSPPTDRPSPERAALAEVLQAVRPRWITCADHIGDTHAASAAFQIVAVLTTARDEPAAAGRSALITSAEADGVVGAALLHLY